MKPVNTHCFCDWHFSTNWMDTNLSFKDNINKFLVIFVVIFVSNIYRECILIRNQEKMRKRKLKYNAILTKKCPWNLRKIDTWLKLYCTHCCQLYFEWYPTECMIIFTAVPAPLTMKSKGKSTQASNELLFQIWHSYWLSKQSKFLKHITKWYFLCASNKLKVKPKMY